MNDSIAGDREVHVCLGRGARGFEEIALPRVTLARADPWSPPAAYPIAIRRVLRSGVSRILVWWRRRRVLRATRCALFELDDHALRDIGLSRAEIDSIASETSGSVEATRQLALQSLRIRSLAPVSLK